MGTLSGTDGGYSKGATRWNQQDVLVRLTAGTTTYHFGRKESICGEVLANEATAMSLDDALDLGRRLCVKCGRLVVAWAGSAIAVAGKKSLVHPDR